MTRSCRWFPLKKISLPALDGVLDRVKARLRKTRKNTFTMSQVKRCGRGLKSMKRKAKRKEKEREKNVHVIVSISSASNSGPLAFTIRIIIGFIV